MNYCRCCWGEEGWGDGEATACGGSPQLEQSGEPVQAERAAQGEMGRWEE